jgi:uncharacterized protein (TIGR02611 family)
MFRALKEQWRDVAKAKPGKRFRKRYYGRAGRRCSAIVKPFYLSLGAALLLTGIVMMPAPGPGCLVALVGATMLAEESLLAARVLDISELKMWAAMHWLVRLWKRASAAMKAAVALAAASLAGLAGWGTYALLFR